VRLPVREPLAVCAFHGNRRRVAIVEAERNSVIVAIIEFGKITVQMFLAAMLIDALHSSPKD
jgi:hypothetical protein